MQKKIEKLKNALQNPGELSSSSSDDSDSDSDSSGSSSGSETDWLIDGNFIQFYQNFDAILSVVKEWKESAYRCIIFQKYFNS